MVRVAAYAGRLRPHDEVAVVLIVVEWAAAGIVHARPSQVHEVANYVHDVGSILHLVDDPLFDFRHSVQVNLNVCSG